MIKSGRAPDYRDRDFGRRSSAPASRTGVPTRLDILTKIIVRFIGDRERAHAALKEIHDDKLYLEKYGTFEAFCRDELGIGRSYAYRLLEAETVKESLDAMSPRATEKINKNGPPSEGASDYQTHSEINERQARALKSAPPAQRVAALKETAATGKVTAKRIAEVVAKRKPPPAVIDVKAEKQRPLIANANPDDWATIHGKAIVSNLTNIETDCLCESYVCDHWKLEAGKRISAALVRVVKERCS